MTQTPVKDITTNIYETLSTTKFDTRFIEKYSNHMFNNVEPLKAYVYEILEILGVRIQDILDLTIGTKKVMFRIKGPTGHPVEERVGVSDLPPNAQAFVKYWDSNE